MLKYTADLEIDPKQQTIRAKVVLAGDGFTRGRSNFCLHRDLVLDSVTGEYVRGYEFGGKSDFPFAPEGGALGVDLAESEGREQEIQFRYHGQLGILAWGVNRITPEWSELGLYTPWFPLPTPSRDGTFAVKLRLPPGFQLVSSGKVRQEEGFSYVDQSFPASDCTLLIAPSFLRKVSRKNEALVAANYVDEKVEATAAQYAKAGAEILDWYNDFFQKPYPANVNIVIAPRQEGGGYARRGFIVFGSDLTLEDSVRIYRYIAHEFAHLWWHGADSTTWEDWLNESFAEYSALLAVRGLLGRKSYDDLLQARREKAVNLPPIMGIDRQADECFAVLYYKGCVLLAELEQELGESKFRALLRELIRRRVRTTATFTAVLAQVWGERVARSFSEKLMK